MEQESIRYAIASVIFVALVSLFCYIIKLVEVGTFIHALNILGLILSTAFAIICAIATEVYWKRGKAMKARIRRLRPDECREDGLHLMGYKYVVEVPGKYNIFHISLYDAIKDWIWTLIGR